MPCYHPIRGYRSKHDNSATGKKSINFGTGGNANDPVQVPCGRCIGCRLEHSRQWAMRMLHEASLWDENCFITLTYDDEYCPNNYSLNKKHYQDFMKRLRENVPQRKIRFYHCGEYGEENLRPHYHAAIFNYDFPDKKIYTVDNGNNIYTSDFLTSVWGHGYNYIGELTFDSAAYIARYVTKKIYLSDKSPEKYRNHYQRVNPYTGEVHNVQPEYATMSRGGRQTDGTKLGGIGKGWFDKYNGETYPSDTIIINGKPVKPPKYYDQLLEQKDPITFEQLKLQRKKESAKYMEDQTYERLETRERVKKAKINHYKRDKS